MFTADRGTPVPKDESALPRFAGRMEFGAPRSEELAEPEGELDNRPTPPTTPWAAQQPTPPAEEPTLLAVEVQEKRTVSPMQGSARDKTVISGPDRPGDGRTSDIRSKLQLGLAEAARSGTLEAALLQAFAVSPREEASDVRSRQRDAPTRPQAHEPAASSAKQTWKAGQEPSTPTIGEVQAVYHGNPEWYTLVSEETATLRDRTAHLEQEVILLRTELQRCMQQLGAPK